MLSVRINRYSLLQDRIKLVQRGVEDLPNVVVVPSGKYMVSAATFRLISQGKKTKSLRKQVWISRYLQPKLLYCLVLSGGMQGKEPYCQVTEAYNQAMLEILPRYGIDVKIIERLEVGGVQVSASQVRELIQTG